MEKSGDQNPDKIYFHGMEVREDADLKDGEIYLAYDMEGLRIGSFGKVEPGPIRMKMSMSLGVPVSDPLAATKKMESENPFEKRCCYDCCHLKAAVSWWCINDDAIKFRGTRIPGTRNCQFWGPDWAYIDEEFHPQKSEAEAPVSRWTKIKNWFNHQIQALCQKGSKRQD